MPERILDFFPLPHLSSQEQVEHDSEVIRKRLELVQQDRVVIQPVGADDGVESIKRPGELYKRYVIVVPTKFRVSAMCYH